MFSARARVVLTTLVVTFTSLFTPACASSRRDSLMAATEHRLEEARANGAEEASPYEFYSARAHLDESRQQGGAHEARSAFRQADQALTLPR